MTPEQLETIVAAIAVKAQLPVPITPLLRGLPRRHDTHLTPKEAADFILREWAGERETQILDRSGDKLRDDYP